MAVKFIWKSVLFIVPIIIAAFLLQYAVDTGLSRSMYYTNALWRDVYHSEINSDLLVLGSSRASLHVSPSILDERLSANSYNLGLDAFGFYMQDYRLKEYLRHNRPPKYVIISLDIFAFRKTDYIPMQEQFLPYLNEPLIFQATKGYKGAFSFFDYHLPFYKYVGHNDLIKTGLYEFFGIKHVTSKRYKGYEAQDKPWDNTFDDFKQKNKNGIVVATDDESIASFEDTLSICKKNKVSVFLVYSPELKEGQKLFLNRCQILNMYKNYAAKYGAVFLDYSDDPICYDRSLFYNSQHLNKKGSEVFTCKLADDIKGRL